VVDLDGDRVANGDGGGVEHGNCKDGDGSAAPRTGKMTATTTATAMGGDRDCPARIKSDHRINSASDCYLTSGGGGTRDGSGSSGSGRDGRNSNRKNGGGGNMKTEGNLH
jgi:hypothetical protein